MMRPCLEKSGDFGAKSLKIWDGTKHMKTRLPDSSQMLLKFLDWLLFQIVSRVAADSVSKFLPALM